MHLVLQWGPYLWKEEVGNHTLRKGLCMDLLYAVSRFLNFRLETVPFLYITAWFLFCSGVKNHQDNPWLKAEGLMESCGRCRPCSCGVQLGTPRSNRLPMEIDSLTPNRNCSYTKIIRLILLCSKHLWKINNLGIDQSKFEWNASLVRSIVSYRDVELTKV